MRRSVDDPDWVPSRDSGHVYVDSVLTAGVVAFDTDEGWVDVHVRDADGKFVIIGDRVATKRFHGVVRFEPYKK